MPVHGDTRLRAGDVITLLIDGDLADDITDLFIEPDITRRLVRI